MILSPIIFKEKLTTVKIASFIVVLVGLILVNVNVVNENGNMWGMICGCMSAVMYFFMITFNKKSKNITGMENATIQLVVSFLTVAVFMLIKQGLVIDLDGVNWFAVIFLGVINTGMCVYFYFSSLAKIPVQSVAVLGYLEPLSAVVLSALILSEQMNWIQIIGAICILGGTMFGELVKFETKSLCEENIV